MFLFLSFFFVVLSFFSSKSLDNLDKIATYFILLKLMLCLLLFQISRGGKSCALFWTDKKILNK